MQILKVFKKFIESVNWKTLFNDKISYRSTKHIKHTKNGRKDTDYFKLQKTASAVFKVISGCKEEYQNDLALK